MLRSIGASASDRELQGIDVSLAVDFVTMAIQDEYDVGIVMSTDADPKPALEAVAQLTDRRAEVAAWSSPNNHPRRMSIAGRSLWCRRLEEADYKRVQDAKNYTVRDRLTHPICRAVWA